VTSAESILPAAGRPRSAAQINYRPDKLGIVIAVIAVLAAFLEPFATFRANRIVSGKGLFLTSALPPSFAALGFFVILGGALLALFLRRPALRLAVAVVVLAGLALLIGSVPAHVVPVGNTLARVAPAAGFWLLTFAFAILLVDAVAKLRLGPFARILALAAAAAAVFVILSSGLWDGLSVLKEYTTHADNFWQEGERHLQLAFVSLAAAVMVGAPLGIACARSVALRSVTPPVLNSSKPSRALRCTA